MAIKRDCERHKEELEFTVKMRTYIKVLGNENAFGVRIINKYEEATSKQIR